MWKNRCKGLSRWMLRASEPSRIILKRPIWTATPLLNCTTGLFSLFELLLCVTEKLWIND